MKQQTRGKDVVSAVSSCVSAHADHAILEVRHLTKHFGGVVALDSCSIAIPHKQITAIIGPNGSGKTTLFDAITRLIPIDAGKISFNGVDITSLKDFEVARLGISRTFQQVRLFRNLTIEQHLAIALHTTDESIIRSVCSIPRNDHARFTAQIKEILALVHLNKPLNTYASELSYGQRKLLDLAIAFAKPHDVLLLDEPVAGVNPKLREEIMDIIKELHGRGETVIIIEHDMNFVMGLASKVFVLEAGKIIAQGTPKDIQSNARVLEAYLGK